MNGLGAGEGRTRSARAPSRGSRLRQPHPCDGPAVRSFNAILQSRAGRGDSAGWSYAMPLYGHPFFGGLEGLHVFWKNVIGV